MLKSHVIKSNNKVIRKNKVDTYGAPNYSPTVVADKMCTNAHEHPIYIRFLCQKLKNTSEVCADIQLQNLAVTYKGRFQLYL